MIYTVTFNPALDYVVTVSDMKLGQVNRLEDAKIFYGGKGINVSLVLQQLDIKSVALGFIAGFTGKEIEQSMKKTGISTEFIYLKEGLSRINVKIRSSMETELNAPGPAISSEEINQLFGMMDDMVKEGDTIVLAGSIPATLPDNIYETIMERMQGKKVRIVVDATKDLLKKVLKYQPFLIKPNNHELAEIFQVDINTKDDVIFYAKKLQDMGAENVLISMAGDGAILVDENGFVHQIGVPSGKVLNSVGAGDSMVAGFMAGYIKTNDYDMALKYGTAAGSATAFSEGLANKELIEELLQKL